MIKRSLLFVTRVCVTSSLCLLLLTHPAQGNEIMELSLDDASSIGTKISTDPVIKQEGRGSIKISTAWPTTINLGQVPNLYADNARLIYRAKVKSERLEGTAYLEMWCHVGDGQYFSRGLNSTVSCTMDSKTLQTLFFLQP